jgi:hypothetical protein
VVASITVATLVFIFQESICNIFLSLKLTEKGVEASSAVSNFAADKVHSVLEGLVQKK